MVAAAGDELVEEVDENGRVLRVVTRREMRAGRLRHRSVFVVVRSSRGEVLVHRRSDDKDLWPGWWDLAVGGVASAGEPYDDAARREVAEEVGVDARPVALDDGVPALYDDTDVSLIGRRYEVVHDGPFAFADGEVVEARFVSLDELGQLVDDLPFLPDSRAIVLPLIR